MRSKTAPARTGHRETADTSGPVSAGRGALLVSTAGLLVAAYLTYEHLTAAASLACPDTGAINCVKVTTSSNSQFLGAPVAVLGLGYFAVMTGLCLPRPWRSPRLALARLRLLLAGAGVLFVVYLIWAELFRINAICVWCTVVHALTLALFAILTVGHALRDTKPTPTEAPPSHHLS